MMIARPRLTISSAGKMDHSPPLILPVRTLTGSMELDTKDMVRAEFKPWEGPLEWEHAWNLLSANLNIMVVIFSSLNPIRSTRSFKPRKAFYRRKISGHSIYQFDSQSNQEESPRRWWWSTFQVRQETKEPWEWIWACRWTQTSPGSCDCQFHAETSPRYRPETTSTSYQTNEKEQDL